MPGSNWAHLNLPGLNPDLEALKKKHEDWTMASLSLAVMAAQADSTAHVGTCTGIMEGLKITCELMNKGFQQACLDVEYLMQKTMEEATAQDWAFTQTTTENLDLWTTAL